MSEKKRIPEIRFGGFEGDWEEKRLGDIAEINPKSTLPDEFLYVDLESVLGTRLINSRVEYINTAPSRAQRLAKYGDVFYQTVRPYQKNNFLFDIVDSNFEFVFSTGYAQLRTTDLENNNYIFQSIQREVFVNEVMLRCTGTSYPAINSTELSKIKVGIPKDLKESEKIGDVLRTIDNIINKIIEKIEKLQSYKQSMLQKMFPIEGEKVPEIRFEGFEGEWEESKLSNHIKIVQGYAFKSETYISNSKYKIITIKNVKGEYFVDTNDVNKTDKLPIDLRKDQILKKKDILISMTGNVGRVSIVKNDGLLLNQRVGKFEILDNNFSRKFMFYILKNKNFENIMINKGQGAAQLNISKDDILQYEIKIPSKKEQNLVGLFFENIDKQIILEQNKLETYKDLKKSLLNRMFI